jgi:integrase
MVASLSMRVRIVGQSSRPLFHCLASTGCRLGEALSLQWGDLDLQARTLHVRRTVYKGAFYAPKSKAAVRTIDLGAQAAGMLGSLKRERFGATEPAADALIFPGRDGKPQDPASLRRGAWAKALKAAGLAHTHPHVLRHAYVSMLIAAGQDIAYISKMVGHSSITITLNTYGHLINKRRPEVADALESALRAPVSGNVVVTVQ